METLADEMLLQVRISSESLDGATLQEIAQLTVALLEIILALLMATIGMIHFIRHLPGPLRLWRAGCMKIAAMCLGRVRFWGI